MELKDVVPHRTEEINKIYERTLTIRFRIAITLITLNSGGTIALLNLIYKAYENPLLTKFASIAVLFFVLGIILSIMSLWKPGPVVNWLVTQKKEL